MSHSTSTAVQISSGVENPLELGSGRNRVTGSDTVSDADLVNHFLTGRDEAFAALMRRHGPSVMRICRRWLGEGQEAEDACQATFLVLVNRADEMEQVENLGGWLCGVARRVAGRARMRANRRRAREGAAVDVRGIAGREHPADDDLSPTLRSEVDRLPEKYRRPIELCYWEGLSSEQAAERLQCPTGTLKWRLSRARVILRGRLSRLGMALVAFLMWRIPSATVRAANPTSLANDGLSAEFVRETIALAVLARDTPLSFLKSNVPLRTRSRSRSRSSVNRGSVPKRWFHNGPMLALIAAAGVLLTIPAICLALAIPTERRPQNIMIDDKLQTPSAVSVPMPVIDQERTCH